MQSATFDRKQTHVVRLEKGDDLMEQLTQYCNENQIDAAHVSVIGAVENANIGFYDQDGQTYHEMFVDEPMELIQAHGNVSFLEGDRFVHLHGTFSTDDHQVIAGHLFEGTTIFAGEAILHELEGPDLIRRDDEPTGLTLWDL